MALAFGTSPVHRMLGIELRERSPAGAELSMPVVREHLQEEGVVQGGILTALADAAAVYLLLPDLGEGRSMTSIELKINFLHPARLGAGELRARAEPLQIGRTIAVCRSMVTQGGRSVAHAIGTYLFRDARPPA